MPVRSDYTLRKLLEKIKNLGAASPVGESIDEALAFMGERTPYRANKELLALLDGATARARANDDNATAARLEDAVRYATGKMLKPDIEIRYQLFTDPSSERDHITRIAAASAQILLSEVKNVLEVRPKATATDIMAALDHLVKNIEHLESVPEQPGYYRIVRGRAEQSAWLRDVMANRISNDEATVSDLDGLSIEVLELLKREGGQLLIEAENLLLRRRALYDVRSVVLNPHSSERDLQVALEQNSWLFGGRYVGLLLRRRLAQLTEIDLPFLRPDGVLHVVEIKRANVKLVNRHRGRVIPAGEVHKAVAQVANYLRTLDECRDKIHEVFGIDTRRATATAVVGHPDFQEGPRTTEVNEALRVYNSHLSRIEVITYKDLLDSAERTLSIASAALAEDLQSRS
jgi:hypothetical protein